MVALTISAAALYLASAVYPQAVVSYRTWRTNAMATYSVQDVFGQA
jgi:type II secretory pathway component PulJ